MDSDNKKPFKIKDVTRNIKMAVVAATLEEIRAKVAEKFDRADEQQLPTIHLDSDGTEIDDEEYFRTLDANTELIAVFPGEHWIDPTHYVTITSHRGSSSGISGEPISADTTDANAAEKARIKQLVGQLQNNLCNVSVMSDPDLDSLSNMDPNSLVDITGKDFMEQLKDSGRPLCAKRNAEDRINLLKLLREGAIFCSERYPEDAEAIDMEISRQLNMDAANTNTNTTINTNTTTTITANTTTVNIGVLTPQQPPTVATAMMMAGGAGGGVNGGGIKTIEQVQNMQRSAVQMTSVDVVTIVETHSAGGMGSTSAVPTAATVNNNIASNNINNNTKSKINDI